MSKIKIFSVYDGKTQTFSRPFFEKHLGAALRSWEEACKTPDSPFFKYPTDFVLYEIGEFDEDTGRISDFVPPRMLSAALDHSGSSSVPLAAVQS